MNYYVWLKGKILQLHFYLFRFLLYDILGKHPSQQKQLARTILLVLEQHEGLNKVNIYGNLSFLLGKK